jgi:hypothetical protein
MSDVNFTDSRGFGQGTLLRSSPVTEDVVKNEMQIARELIDSTGTIYPSSSSVVSAAKKRNLGGAIVLAAIGDYRGMDEQAHNDAALFLYPKTDEQQQHYDWAVALAAEVNPAWLRDALDRFKTKWDWQRFERKALRERRA